MHEVHRRAIVPYSANAMFDLVADVNAYAEFVPWCSDARVLSGPEPVGSESAAEIKQLVARLGVSQGLLTGHFTTCNRMQRPHVIDMTLVEGSFRELEGRWRFESLGEAGCELDLTMRFAFSSAIQDLLFGRVFEDSCSKLVDAFAERAHSVYG